MNAEMQQTNSKLLDGCMRGTFSKGKRPRRFSSFFFLFLLASSSTTTRALTLDKRPLIISSDKFGSFHRPPSGYHPENEMRINEIHKRLGWNATSDGNAMLAFRIPTGEKSREAFDAAVLAIKQVHSSEYVDEVKERSEAGFPNLSPFDSDTYLTKSTYKLAVLAQTAWLDGLKHCLQHTHQPVFVISRPPGHHAEKANGGGFCYFNYAAVTANYALENKLCEKIAILDFDVHYGNGVSALVANQEQIAYCSIHQGDIYPLPPPQGKMGKTDNILNLSLQPGDSFKEYLPLLEKLALPFLADFKPDVLIVCAGYDALASDYLSQVNLQPKDYAEITKSIKTVFGSTPMLFGLEGGYNLEDLPLAVHASIEPFTK